MRRRHPVAAIVSQIAGFRSHPTQLSRRARSPLRSLRKKNETHLFDEPPRMEIFSRTASRFILTLRLTTRIPIHEEAPATTQPLTTVRRSSTWQRKQRRPQSPRRKRANRHQKGKGAAIAAPFTKTSTPNSDFPYRSSVSTSESSVFTRNRYSSPNQSPSLYGRCPAGISPA